MTAKKIYLGYKIAIVFLATFLVTYFFTIIDRGYFAYNQTTTGGNVRTLINHFVFIAIYCSLLIILFWIVNNIKILFKPTQRTTKYFFTILFKLIILRAIIDTITYFIYCVLNIPYNNVIIVFFETLFVFISVILLYQSLNKRASYTNIIKSKFDKKTFIYLVLILLSIFCCLFLENLVEDIRTSILQPNSTDPYNFIQFIELYKYGNNNISEFLSFAPIIAIFMPLAVKHNVK